MNKKKHYLLRPEPLFWKKGQKTNFYMEDFLGVFFGNYWDPNEHNPAGFALVAVISFIGCFWPFVASSKPHKSGEVSKGLKGIVSS